MVDPATGELDHRGDRVVGRRVDHVARAELLRQHELRREPVHRDDVCRAGETCGLDRVETDTAAADHYNGVTAHDAALSTAPTPVVTPQPMSAAFSSGIS